ncbi:hypothetical protein BH11ACT1_BH11ACT1_18130 [soil metagenome]
MTTTERDVERRALLDLIRDKLDRRRPVPCQTSPDRDRWTSDDPADQSAAAADCHDCSALAACALYGTSYPDEFGVYGGRTRTDRRPKRGRLAKTKGTTP